MKTTALFLAAILANAPLVLAAEAPAFSLSFDEEISSSPQTGVEIVESAGSGIRTEILNGERTPGRHGTALRFNGISARDGGTLVVIPKSPSGTDPIAPFLEGPFTIAAWVRFDEDCAPEGAFELVNKSGSAVGPGIRWYYTWKAVNFLTGDGEGSEARVAATEKGATNIPFGEWIHLAVTRDGAGTVQMYLNGEPVAASPGDLGITASETPMMFGGWNNDYPFKGLMDEIAIWTSALDESEIQNLAR